jgi:hypothetical protein
MFLVNLYFFVGGFRLKEYDSTSTQTSFTISAACNRCNVPTDRFNVHFVYAIGLQPAVITHNSSAGNAHKLIISLLPSNQPAITVWTFIMKRLDPFSLLKHMPFDTNRLYHFITSHSILTAEQLTKGSNKTCETHIILSPNIQYLIIHIRNLILLQASQ